MGLCVFINVFMHGVEVGVYMSFSPPSRLSHAFMVVAVVHLRQPLMSSATPSGLRYQTHKFDLIPIVIKGMLYSLTRVKCTRFSPR